METIQTCWIKYECEHGARWTVAKNLIGGKVKNSGRCNFAGCKEGHTFSKVGGTSDINEARNWYNNPYG